MNASISIKPNIPLVFRCHKHSPLLFGNVILRCIGTVSCSNNNTSKRLSHFSSNSNRKYGSRSTSLSKLSKLLHKPSLNCGKHNTILARCKSTGSLSNSNSPSSSQLHRQNSNSKDSLVSSNFSINDGKTVVDRYLYVKTLVGMYEDIPTGIVLDTAYGDSRPDSDFDSSVPVVLCLHDTPGSHTDVVPLMDFFAKIGCRVVCPTFPGHGDTRGIMRNYDDIFSQATIEKAAFVHDFIDNAGIKRVDVLVAVGAASYTAMALCTRRKEIYKSMALVSPWPLHKPRFDIDSKMLKHVHDMWELVYLRPFARPLLTQCSIGNSLTVDDKIAACYLAKNVDYGELEGLALTIGVQDIPRLVAFGAADDLVSDEMYREVLDKLEIPASQIFNGPKSLSSQGSLANATGVVFPDSGYDLLHEQRSALCASILQLIRKFHPHFKF